MFVPTLERFWGTARFYRFVAITSIVGTIGRHRGRLPDRVTSVAIYGLNPFIYASIVAFGIIYARQPVQFFGVLPLTGRQLMYGFIGFLSLFVVLQQLWEQGAAFAAAMLTAAVMTSKRWSPGLAWKRWRIAAGAREADRDAGRGGQAGEARRAEVAELSVHRASAALRRRGTVGPDGRGRPPVRVRHRPDHAVRGRVGDGPPAAQGQAGRRQRARSGQGDRDHQAARAPAAAASSATSSSRTKRCRARTSRSSARDDGYRLRDLNSRNGIFVGELRDPRGRTCARARCSASATRTSSSRRLQDVVEIELSKKDRFDAMLGASPAMREIFAHLEKVAPSELTVPDHRRDRHRQGDGRARAPQRVARARPSRSSCSTAARSRAS